MNNNQDTLVKFLSYVPGQEEVSLIITSDDFKNKQTEEAVEKEGFVKVNNLKELLSGINKQKGGYCLPVSKEDNLKKIYDFIVQYPMKQIRMLDQETREEEIISPDYSALSIVILISQETLGEFKKQGFDILSKSGMTYQINTN